jgi:hypothetical protein
MAAGSPGRSGGTGKEGHSTEGREMRGFFAIDCACRKGPSSRPRPRHAPDRDRANTCPEVGHRLDRAVSYTHKCLENIKESYFRPSRSYRYSYRPSRVRLGIPSSALPSSPTLTGLTIRPPHEPHVASLGEPTPGPPPTAFHWLNNSPRSRVRSIPLGPRIKIKGANSMLIKEVSR